MTRYQIIAKRFRPQKFQDVFGQDPIIATLKNALRMKRVAHAYLFSGSRGTGKTTLVRLFAKAINCHNLSQDFEPCNECPSCQDITGGKSLDILEIDGASNRGIDDIRQINDTVGYASSHGGFKIIIIDEVHMLTKEAFNALLKTLEEPPEKVKFFFATTEPHKVLSTIASRCQRFDLSRIPPQAMVAKLEQICQTLEVNIEEDALRLITRVAEGSLRDAESLLDQAICYQEGTITYDAIRAMLGILPLEVFAKIDQAYDKEHYKEAFLLSDEIYQSGIDPTYFFTSLLDHYRNILLVHHGLPVDRSKHTRIAAQIYEKSATIYSKWALEEALNWITTLLQHQVNGLPLGKVDIEMTLLHIMKQKKRVSYDQLIDQLRALQAKVQPSSSSTTKPLPHPSNSNVDTSSPKQEHLHSNSNADASPLKQEHPHSNREVKATISKTSPPSNPTPKTQPQKPTTPQERKIETPQIAENKEIAKDLSPPIVAEQASLLGETAPPAAASITAQPAPSTPTSPPKANSTEKPQESSTDLAQKIHHDSLLNFAAVELRGSLK